MPSAPHCLHVVVLMLSAALATTAVPTFRARDAMRISVGTATTRAAEIRAHAPGWPTGAGKSRSSHARQTGVSRSASARVPSP